MATKQDVIDAIALIATAQGNLETAIVNVREAHVALHGGVVSNVTVKAGGLTTAGIMTTLATAIGSLNALSDAVADKVVAADDVADALA